MAIKVSLAAQAAHHVTEANLCLLAQVNHHAEGLLQHRLVEARIAEQAAKEGLEVDFALRRWAEERARQARNAQLLAERRLRARRDAEQPMAVLVQQAAPKRGTPLSMTAPKGVVTPRRRPALGRVNWAGLAQKAKAQLVAWSRVPSACVRACMAACRTPKQVRRAHDMDKLERHTMRHHSVLLTWELGQVLA